MYKDLVNDSRDTKMVIINNLDMETIECITTVY